MVRLVHQQVFDRPVEQLWKELKGAEEEERNRKKVNAYVVNRTVARIEQHISLVNLLKRRNLEFRLCMRILTKKLLNQVKIFYNIFLFFGTDLLSMFRQLQVSEFIGASLTSLHLYTSFRFR